MSGNPEQREQLVSTVVGGPRLELETWMQVFGQYLSSFNGAEVVAANGLKAVGEVCGWCMENRLPVRSLHGPIGREVRGTGFGDMIKILVIEQLVVETPSLAGAYWGASRALSGVPDILVHTPELYTPTTRRWLEELAKPGSYEPRGRLAVENHPTIRGGVDDTLTAVEVVAGRGIRTMYVYDPAHARREWRASGNRDRERDLWRLVVGQFETVLNKVAQINEEYGQDIAVVGLHVPIGGLEYDAIPQVVLQDPSLLGMLAEAIRSSPLVRRVVVENQMELRDYLVGGTKAQERAYGLTQVQMERLERGGVVVG